MDLADLDRALDHLRRATERAGANLLELDQSSSRALLAAARLEGLSAKRWAEAEGALAGLFQSYAALSGVVDAAAAARGSGSFVTAARRAQVEQLVLGPSVELPERAVPMAERDLVSGSRVLHRCTPDELLASMAQPFALARSVVVTAAEAWEAGGPLVQSVRARLVDASEDGDLGGAPDGRAALERRLDAIEHRLLADPLAFDLAEVEALGAEVDGVVATADGARRVRDDFETDLAAAHARLAELGRSTTDVLRAHEDAGARVVLVPPPPAIPLEDLGGELDRIAALAAVGDWMSVQAELGAGTGASTSTATMSISTARGWTTSWNTGGSCGDGSMPTPPSPPRWVASRTSSWSSSGARPRAFSTTRRSTSCGRRLACGATRRPSTRCLASGRSGRDELRTLGLLGHDRRRLLRGLRHGASPRVDERHGGARRPAGPGAVRAGEPAHGRRRPAGRPARPARPARRAATGWAVGWSTCRPCRLGTRRPPSWRRRTCPSSGASAASATSRSAAAGTAWPGDPRASAAVAAARSRSSPSWRPGDLVAGQYEVAGCLAHGGLGWIYLAKDRKVADRWVVLKGLINTDDEDALAAALAERRFLAQVEHPDIVKIHNFVEHDGDGYIVMEYVNGYSLRSLLEARRAAAGDRPDPMPVDEAIAYTLEILPALGHLHDLGLLFCDFKPDNVIRTPESVKLIDLGGVYRMDDATSPIYGTPGYQAPEIARTGPTVPSDLFTVARTLMVLCCDFRGYRGTYQYTLPPAAEVPLFVEHDSLYRFLERATAAIPTLGSRAPTRWPRSSRACCARWRRSCAGRRPPGPAPASRGERTVRVDLWLAQPAGAPRQSRRSRGRGRRHARGDGAGGGRRGAR